MSEFVNTIDLIGDDALTDGLISETLTELRDDRVRVVPSQRFYGNTSLVTIEFPNVTEVGFATFAKATALTTINLPKLTKVYGNTFEGCISLTTVNLQSLTDLYEHMFNNCNSLTNVKLDSLESWNNSAFYKCSSLRILEVPNLKAVYGHSSLDGCSSLVALIIRRTDSLATLPNTNHLDDCGISAGTGYIYVPRSLVDSYKAASNWSVHASQIRPLEDYTVDGTLTGEFDETKI